MTEQVFERGIWRILFQPDDPEGLPVSLIQLGPTGAYRGPLADLTETEFRDLAACAAAACGVVVARREELYAELREVYDVGYVDGVEGDPALGLDRYLDSVINRLTAAPASAAAEE